MLTFGPPRELWGTSETQPPMATRTVPETLHFKASQSTQKVPWEPSWPKILLRMTMSMLMTILIIMKMMMVVLRMTTTIMTVIAVIMTI